MNKTILNKIMKDNKLDVIISYSEQTKFWYTSVMASAGLLFIEPKESFLFLDGRYFEIGSKTAKNVEVLRWDKESIGNFVAHKDKQYKTIGIEREYLTIGEQDAIKAMFPKAKLVAINSKELRIIKSKEEADAIRDAAKIALKALAKVKPLIKAGTRECDIDAELNKQARLLGASKMSFDSIVVSGKNGSLPHGKPSTKKLKDGELVTIDFGVVYKGFCSDITRTFRVGKVTNKKLLEIEQVLTEAQKLGVKAVKPGVTTLEIDKVCRDYITSKGYGEFFVHSTGHGLGIDVHELPVVASNKAYEQKLKPGMVITVEPGIYIPNLGGIRIEDDVLVTEEGYEVLSKG